MKATVPRSLLLIATGAFIFTACKHTSPAPLTYEQPVESKQAFTVKSTVSELDESYCLSVVLIETKGTTGANQSYDQLTVPNLCIPKGDGAEHVLSRPTKTPAAMDKPLPFHKVALQNGEPGVEVRFKIEAQGVATYSILYRLPNSKREHRWSGQDVLPPNQ